MNDPIETGIESRTEGSHTRRDVLKTGVFMGASLAFSSFLPRSAFATAPRPDERFFVMLRISPAGGGLDVTLGLDPWLQEQRSDPNDLFIEYRHDQLVKAGNIWLGPSGQPLVKHSKDLLVLNGVLLSESDNGHEAAMNYVTTGNGQGRASDLPVEIEAIRGISPYGLLSTDAVSLGSRRVPYTRASDVVASLTKADPSSALERSVRDPRTPLERAVQGVVQSKEVTKVMRERLGKVERDASGVVPPEGVAIASFLSGACRHAQIDFFLDGNLDTHSNHEGIHLDLQTKAWERVSSIFDLFKSTPFGEQGESMFDRTTFMVVSEFSRTPYLNSAKGKDHNPFTNSILFAGAGLQTAKSIGASLSIGAKRSKSGIPYHMAAPFDFATGLPARTREGAGFVYPENVVLTVAAALGADLSKFQSVPKGTKLIPGVVL